jgi:hypothetical protein
MESSLIRKSSGKKIIMFNEKNASIPEFNIKMSFGGLIFFLILSAKKITANSIIKKEFAALEYTWKPVAINEAILKISTMLKANAAILTTAKK